VAAEYGYLLHTDAVQSFGHVLLDVDVMGVDMMSASAHKLGGPKGIGLLYLRRGTKIVPTMYGGGQEHGLRSGTENVAGIVGFGEACRLAGIRMSADTRYIHELRDRLVYRILNEIPDSVLTGPQLPDMDDKRLPGHCSFAFKGVQGSSLVIGLDIKNICASTGAACSAAANRPSRVLKEIGVGAEYFNGSLRLTLSRNNTIEEVDRTVDAVKAGVTQLREMFGDY
ncbi:MAG: aminotransferase class V-fold PLP-dependent enzyme, partial [Lachnospiraceae bacterium]|nr:aminotransferase class V-fold PLP-dependent enzyme [Lachnospiraceae bacterium]